MNNGYSSLSVLFVVTALFTGCINWADAPFLERTDALPGKLGKRFQSEHPDAELAGAVYRLHMEQGWRGYNVTSTDFLFKDAKGRIHQATIGHADTFVVREVVMVERLPVAFVEKMMKAPGAPLAGASVTSGPWVFGRDGKQVWQFEFLQGERSGLCTTTDIEGSSHSLQYFRQAR